MKKLLYVSLFLFLTALLGYFLPSEKDNKHEKVTIEVFPNQELGSDQEMIEAIRTGRQAIGAFAYRKINNAHPENAVPRFTLLFLIKRGSSRYSG